MTINIRRQINNADGSALAGATVQAYVSGESTVRATTTSDAAGIVELALADTLGVRLIPL